MSDINSSSESGNQKSFSISTHKKQNIRIDMTPMVDLGFLLITFFVFTTTMLKPAGMDVNRPIPDIDPTPEPQSRAMTLLLGKDDKLFWYMGMNKTGFSPEVHTTDFSDQGIRNVLKEKDNEVRKSTGYTNRDQSDYDRNGLILIVKPMNNSIYKNLVDVLDEIKISEITSFAWTDVSTADELLIESNGLNR